VEQGGTSEQQHVAALIPNQGPYHPIRELTRVNFGFDTDALTPQAKRILDRNAQWLAANPSVRVRVEGHCDERGTNEYNLGLGQRRADRVIAYLVSKGVQARVLHPVSFGEEVPLANGHDPQAWAQNRRVDFSYLDDDATGATTFAPEQARQ
jgi:peptidoglycan-associated lipoprotein